MRARLPPNTPSRPLTSEAAMELYNADPRAIIHGYHNR
jgi:hypothetical protein